MSNEGYDVLVPTVIMENETTVYEFDEMDLAGRSRVWFYHPLESHVNVTAHRIIGDRTAKLHLRMNQTAWIEYVESLNNITEAPVSYQIDLGSEIVLPTEVHLQGVDTTVAGMMTGE